MTHILILISQLYFIIVSRKRTPIGHYEVTQMVAVFAYTNRHLKLDRHQELLEILNYFKSLDGLYDVSNDFHMAGPGE